MSSQIFISYRRDGGDVTAKLICETLKNRGYTVFYDYDALKSGFFDESILHSIEECTDFIIVLPPLALERCYDENDWVRSEIRHAITCRKNIVPVTLDGF
ncbi:MAG: toll/interleukin-1 receptor domain-containing protein, partial [Clostridia bacterium]|nr:toll/interleukin-1 receptor domain-containing protein [Clostridia bacterium]